MPGLQLKNVSKKFGPTTALEDVSLILSDGELLVLLGPSGCGKTTILRLIAGLETLDHGEIYRGGVRIDRMPPKDRQVAMVFQNYALYPHMTVEKNLAFPLKVAGVGKGEIKERVRQTACLLGLEDRLGHRPGSLSGGQRQRVALGRAIIRKPALFLLDEPLSNLDADLRTRMRQEIVRLQKELMVTTVYVTHDQTEALTMADRIAVLHEGRLLQVGRPEQLYRDPDCLEVAQFIGQPRLNVIPVAGIRAACDLFACHLSVAPDASQYSSVLTGIRPESIVIVDTGPLRGVVSSCEYLGSQYVVALSFGDYSLTVSGSGRHFETGREVNFSVIPEQLLFFDSNGGRRIRL